MKEQDRKYYEEFNKFFTEFIAAHEQLIKRMQNEPDLNEMGDMAFVLSRVADLAQEVKKRAASTSELIERLICLRWAKESLDGSPIKTEYCTITPRTKMAAKLPRKETPEYAALMESLKIPQDLVKVDCIRPHWPGVVEYITGLMESGAPLPPGIDPNDTYPVFGLTIRKKKDIL